MKKLSLFSYTRQGNLVSDPHPPSKKGSFSFGSFTSSCCKLLDNSVQFPREQDSFQRLSLAFEIYRFAGSIYSLALSLTHSTLIKVTVLYFYLWDKSNRKDAAVVHNNCFEKEQSLLIFMQDCNESTTESITVRMDSNEQNTNCLKKSKHVKQRKKGNLFSNLFHSCCLLCNHQQHQLVMQWE